MDRAFVARTLTTSLAIFAMLFGAGNLILPLSLGLLSGSSLWFGIAGFTLTGVILPLIGLLTIISFDGDYRAFFGRLGRIPGALIIFYCMLTIGPVIVMPRIVSLSYSMMSPFMPNTPQWLFAFVFLALVFLATYKQGRLLTVIGRILSPLKITSIVSIIAVGLYYKNSFVLPSASAYELFWKGIWFGYGTLDLLGAIFFGAIIVTLLRRDNQSPKNERDLSSSIAVAAYASVIAAFVLGLVYVGMTYLGALHGHGLLHRNPGELFSDISFRVLGTCGAAIIGCTVFLACFTTTVSLTAVVADYARRDIFAQKLSYPLALLCVLAVCLVPASLDLSVIMEVSMPFIEASYPVFIMITACNALYKLCNIRMIKTPVALTILALVIIYYKG